MARRMLVRESTIFSRFSNLIAHSMGHPLAFSVACVIILAWAATGPLFEFSNTWQLFINSTTTIVTFLMVFVIQNTQNRDGGAVQIKLDELIRATKGAHNALLDLEELSQEDLERFRQLYEKLAERARRDVAAGLKDTGSPEVMP